MLNIWDKVIDLNHETLISGDINIDRHIPNNPESRPELKEMIKMIEKFMRDKSVNQVNFKPTRHRNKQRSTLLDLFIVNCPDKCSDIRNGINSTSEHEYVVLNLLKQPVVRKTILLCEV